MALVIEAGDCTQFGSNSTNANLTVSIPAYANGDLIIINIGVWQDNNDDQSVTFPTGPNGETITAVTTDSGPGVGNYDAEIIGIGWFIGLGSSGETNITVTATNATARHDGTVVKVLSGEFDPTTPISTATAEADSGGANVSSLTRPTFSAGSTDGGGKQLTFVVIDQDPSSSSPAGYTTIASNDRGRVSTVLSARNAEVTDSESITSIAHTGFNDAACLFAYIVREASFNIGVDDVTPSGQIKDGTAITVDGFGFEATQGTGKVEIADGPTYATATKVNQTTSLTWSDTQLTFSADIGSFTWGLDYYLFVTNDTGDLSLGFSLSIGDPAPIVEAIPCVVLSTSDDLWVSGQYFEPLQGTGRVILSSNDTYGTGTEVIQTINSWSDSLITFDAVTTGLSNGMIYLFVDTENDQQSDPIPLMLGTSTMQNYIDNELNPDHYHPFDSNKEDVQNPGATQAWDDQELGAPVLSADPLTRGSTNSYDFDLVTKKSERPNSSLVNTAAIQRRQLIIWFKLDEILTGLGLIYEEGGGVNNIYWSVGFGNKLLANFSDENDFEIQCYSDKALKPNRIYMATNKWEGTGYRNIAELLVDGKLQSVSAGNPPDRITFSSHSGDLAIGDSVQLNTGGTDIDYRGAPMNVAHWATWAGTENGGNMGTSWSDMHHRLAFQLGAPADTTVPAGTEAVMQTWVENNLDNTSPADAACCVDISAVTGDGDFTLTLTNVAFDADASLYINYLGTGTLTIVNSGTTNVTYDKVNSTAGGGIVIESPALVTVSGAPTGSTIVVLNHATRAEIGRTASSSGDYSLSVSVAAIDIIVIADDFKVLYQQNIAISGDKLIPVVLEPDYAYENP